MGRWFSGIWLILGGDGHRGTGFGRPAAVHVQMPLAAGALESGGGQEQPTGRRLRLLVCHRTRAYGNKFPTLGHNDKPDGTFRSVRSVVLGFLLSWKQLDSNQ